MVVLGDEPARPAVFDRAQGSYVYAESGREFLDFFTGVATLSYGHHHPGLKQALIDYLQRDGLMHSLDTFTVAKRDFLERLRDHVVRPRGVDYRVMFPGSSGINAVEAGLKLARKITGRVTAEELSVGLELLADAVRSAR